MKYYFMTIEERNGEQEYIFRHVCGLEDNPETYLDELCQNWYGDMDDEEIEEEDIPQKEDGGYYLLGGCVFVSPGRIEEITEEEYNVLNKFL